jgi:hypothetical protein
VKLYLHSTIRLHDVILSEVQGELQLYFTLRRPCCMELGVWLVVRAQFDIGPHSYYTKK